MNKPFLFLFLLFGLVHGRCIAQQPGSVQWTITTDPGPMMDSLRSIKVQADGKIVAAGNSYQGSYMVIAVGRYDGTPMLDPSFGNNGISTTPLDSANTVANAVELQPDGKIVVAGSYRKGTASDFILVRYKTDGITDSSFGVNGIVRTDINSGSFDVATALAIQPDGKIVAAGRSGSSLALCRFKSDGSLDSSFDSDGKVTVAAVPGSTCMKLQPDGKIVVSCDSVVTRLLTDGSLDSSFGTSGVVMLAHYFYGVAIQNDGKIIVAGGEAGFVLQRLSATGAIDSSFGTGGVVKTYFIPGSYTSGVAKWVCLQADGRILAGGFDWYCAAASCRDFAIARYESNGALDTSFGNHGQVYPNMGYYAAMSYSAAINNNNELVVAGISAGFGFPDPFEWLLASYYLGPSLDVATTLGANRQIMVSPNPVGDFARLQSAHVENGKWHFSLYDLTGRTLYSETILVKNNTFDKNISLIGLPAAMYLVKLDNGISRMTVRLAKSR
ncbi:T9SS type A sorting domain-containing protein [Chitinophagaceae bacterium MMS25-I14]